MSARTSREPLREGLSLRTPADTGLTVRAAELEIDRDGGRLLEVRLRAHLAFADWALVDHRGWFHLDPEVRGPVFGGAFLPDREVEILARLAPEYHALLATPAGRRLLMVEVLRAAPDASPLRQTESWWALTALQQRGRVKAGMRVRRG